MVRLKIDGHVIDVPDHYNLLQAIEEAHIEVPRFCYHERLSVAGNCRMCLVEVKGAPPKPVASCATSVTDLRPPAAGELPEVYTQSEMVKKARSGVLEFLLINHPLDCPICDQGGECDLQDQALAYGRKFSRYREDKRSIADKYLGPLINTAMTRCIQCTRCVRFITEVAGISELGLVGRGEEAQITSYLEQALVSKMQGNLADLCPVGALTSKPYAFRARPWELSKTDSIDVMDAVGCAIRIDSRGNEVMRILPRINEEINEEWISDKARFVCDGLRMQRLDQPFIRVDGKLRQASWQEAFATIAQAVSSAASEKIGAIAGDMASLEEMYALKQLLLSLGSQSFDCRQDGTSLRPESGRASYLFNSAITGIEKADALLLIGADIENEACVLQARIYQHFKQSRLPIGRIGQQAFAPYPVTYLGKGTEALSKLLAGEGAFVQCLQQAHNPLIIIGPAALKGATGQSILVAAAKLAYQIGACTDEWNGFSILHSAASRVGGLELGFVPAKKEITAQDIVRDSEILFLLGADEIQLQEKAGFCVYIGSHGDYAAHHADVILPAAAYTEKSGLYINIEGRVQLSNRAIFPPGFAKEDWAIIRALSEFLGKPLPYTSLMELREQLFSDFPLLKNLDQPIKADKQDIYQLAQQASVLPQFELEAYVRDFYFTNAIARASTTMAECSKLQERLKASAVHQYCYQKKG